MEFYKTIPKKIIMKSTRERYKIINNEIKYGDAVSSIFKIIEKPKSCKKCKFFVICNLIEAHEIEFCTIEKCENGYYKGEE